MTVVSETKDLRNYTVYNAAQLILCVLARIRLFGAGNFVNGAVVSLSLSSFYMLI